MVCVYYSKSDNALLRYGHLKFSKMAAGRHLQPEMAPFDPPSSKTPPYRTKREVDRLTRCRVMGI